ncbi:larval cuticle protein 65Ag1-like [Frankliniella occidentalis]|uniref:Larval cuticle protein 65Ag1-like n=1 Tax=Frankliniella occidentalis TaxID=133901 RepID=A0A6J1SA63_FRAOC|nr:larval cuticle protein 65Ag1-like [Frankliniella occidentalis]
MNTLVAVVVAFVAVAAVAQARPQEPTPKPIAILKLASDVQPDGSFTYEYETENGIKADARGNLVNAGTENEALNQQGSFSFVADDGQTYSITWVADENGFQPQGAHIPVPPPIPEEILKALEYNAAHPEEDEEATKRRN